MMTTKKQNVKLIAYAEPHAEALKAINSDIKKESFEERLFYPPMADDVFFACEQTKQALKDRVFTAPEPLVDVKINEFTKREISDPYIEIPAGKDVWVRASILKFDDGSIYKIGSGFLNKDKEEIAEDKQEEIAEDKQEEIAEDKAKEKRGKEK